MGKQVFNIKGMMRDLDPAKTPNQYAYEIRNLRLTAQEDSTMLALVSEKGNLQYIVTGDAIEGVIIGYCTLNDYLVLFTYQSEKEINNIYRLQFDTSANSPTFDSTLLYTGELGMDDSVTIETIGVYENQNIQKVYWIDGIHQPRFINISPNADTSHWYSSPSPFDFVPAISMNEEVSVEKVPYSGMFNSGTIQYVLTYYNRNGQQSAAFYQSPINYISPNGRGASPEDTVDNSFRIRVYNPSGAFDYVRIYSIFRSSENGTPICKKVYDLKTNDTLTETRTFVKFTGVSLGTETSVPYRGPVYGAAFDVYVVDGNNREVDLEDFLLYREDSTSYYSIDSHYSIFIVRKSSPSTIEKVRAADNETMSVWKYSNVMGINRGGSTYLRYWASVTANQLDDDRTRNYIEYVDNGLSSEVVSYSEILYAGGTNIIPATMAQKSQTLFFGNYTSAAKISEQDKETIKNNSNIHFGYSLEEVSKGSTGSYYMYHNQLDGDAKKITTFKGRERYYFGIILQDEYGTWTDVIPVGDGINPFYPKDKSVLQPESFYPVKAYVHFLQPALDIINTYKAIKIVRLDTFPSVMYQGVLCPTVFSKKRANNSPYCMASWFFRSIKPGKTNALTSHHTQNLHNGNIREGLGITVNSGGSVVSTPVTEISEIQGASPDLIGYYDSGTNVSSLREMDMFVDWNTLTLNSPDIEFGQKSDINYKMRLVGILPITSGRTSMLLTWSTPPASQLSSHLEYTPIVNNNLDTSGYEIDLNVLAYKDSYTGSSDINGTYLYPVYPWHRNGSLTGEGTPTGDDEWSALLETKVMASLRESASTKYIKKETPYYITGFEIYQDDETLLLLEEDTDNWLFNSSKVYAGSMDVALTADNTGYRTYGKSIVSGSSVSVINTGIKDAVRMKYKSTKHGVFSLKSFKSQGGGSMVQVLPNVGIAGNQNVPNSGSYANITPKAQIKGKLTPTSVSSTADWLTISGNITTSQFNVGDVIMLTNSGYTSYLYFVKSIVNSSTMTIRALDGYGYPNYGDSYGADVEQWLENHPGGDMVDYQSVPGSNDETGEYWVTTTYKAYFTIYDSTNGMEYYYVTIEDIDGYTLIGGMEQSGPQHEHTVSISSPVLDGAIPDSNTSQIVQDAWDVSSVNSSRYAYMYLAELYTDSLKFNYENTPWYVASEPMKTGKMGYEASIGDTYFQRYDCLKTYPYTLEDQNQIVEIFSFMCETRINIDGRYDNRRGMADNTSVLNTNFNLINRAYTQNDNFFSYYYIDQDDYDINEFPNQIIWTGTKVYGSEIDAWTQILPTSTLDMDGSLGEVRALRLWNDNLICFQDMGIAKIMYNERTTMSTEQGIPVEIANSGKVDGSQYISNQIGCSNKNSIQITQDGIYFIDSNTREIYRWAKGLESLSKSKGFNTYMQQSNLHLENEKSFYDPKLKDIYFRFNRGNSTECLVYNEQIGEFTSFFDYDMDFLFPFKDSLVSVEHSSGNLWKQFAGTQYLRYFGRTHTSGGVTSPAYEDYTIEIVSAENPTEDKIFTGLEFRADVLIGSVTSISQSTYSGMDNLASINRIPFKTLRVWNEYQDTGSTELVKMLRRSTNLSQKFRIWRADIGRNRTDKIHQFSRIRSPWARIRLKGGDELRENNMKTVIHDIAVTYI